MATDIHIFSVFGNAKLSPKKETPIYEWMVTTEREPTREDGGRRSEQRPCQTNQTRAADNNPTRRTGRGQAPQDGRRGEGNPKPCHDKQNREPDNNLTRGTGGGRDHSKAGRGEGGHPRAISSYPKQKWANTMTRHRQFKNP